MTKNVGIIVFLALFGAPAASADIFTDYKINFTGNGTLPTAGSFTYDQTNPHFSSFLVTWEGSTFDLTSSANAPISSSALPGCIDGTADAEASFDLLSGDCQGTQAFPAWGGIASSSGAEFRFAAIESAAPFQSLQVFGTVAGNFATNGSGLWTTSAAVAPVPEPTSAILMATVLAMASFLARKRFGQKSRHAAIE